MAWMKNNNRKGPREQWKECKNRMKEVRGTAKAYSKSRIKILQ
jgi:hypothetical protein